MFQTLLVYILVTHPELSAIFVSTVIGRGVGVLLMGMLSYRYTQPEIAREIKRIYMKQGTIFTSIAIGVLAVIMLCGMINHVSVVTFLVINIISVLGTALIILPFIPHFARLISKELKQKRSEANKEMLSS